MMPANTGENQGRFAKGHSGNPQGKPKGARHRTTLAAEALLAGEIEKLTRKAVELALDGDTTALRLCLERVVPVRRERAIELELPVLRSAADSVAAMTVFTDGVANGALTPGEALALSKLVETFVKALEADEFDQRLRFLEGRQNDAQY
jgi:Family of unknown function (DUF5681)